MQQLYNMQRLYNKSVIHIANYSWHSMSQFKEQDTTLKNRY